MKPKLASRVKNPRSRPRALPELRVLRLLQEAAEAAEEVGRDLWEFAVEIPHVLATRATSSDLRRMLCEGLLLAGVETTRPSDRTRRFRRSVNLSLTDRTCFVITAAGAAYLRAGVPDEDAAAASFQAPHWDRGNRTLFWNGRMVKRFRVPAPNQERVLDAFEEAGWPSHLDDPLCQGNGREAKQGLHDTIKRLNLRQVERSLRFWGNGTGMGVCWEPL